MTYLDFLALHFPGLVAAVAIAVAVAVFVAFHWESFK